MKKIYYLQKHEVKLGDVIEYAGIRTIITEELIELDPELFIVEDTMQELLDKAKRDYPVGTMIDSRNGIQEVLGDNPFVGIGIEGSIQINTDLFTGGATIYTPEDGWSKILPLKFTTEDGVDIYGDMKTYLVHPNDSGDIRFWHCSWDGGSKGDGNKYFYHKENALAYIKKCREKTLEDYENILFKRGNSIVSSSGSVYAWLRDNEPKLYYTKVLQLIADDLHEERYTHIHMNTSYHINNAYGVNVHCGYDEGCVYFKSKELAEKARDILGDKVKYLYDGA